MQAQGQASDPLEHDRPTVQCRCPASASETMPEIKLNLRGLKCPLPALKARKSLSGLAAGDTLLLECTDPLTEIDIPNLVRETGDILEHRNREGTPQGALYVFRIRKAAGPGKDRP
jgi:tRNA 2-thiouridine synthesizing protein A